MGLLSGLRNSIAFLTILPVGMDREGLSEAASYMPIYPAIGALVGLIVGFVVWALEPFLTPLIAGMIGLGLLLLINGVQHLDGLLDFGDGVMFHGPRTGKLRVMRDPTTGAGGLALGLVVSSIAAFSIAALPLHSIILGVIVAEAAANFSMVLTTGISKAAHRGMGSLFVEAMNEHRLLRITFSFIILLVICVLSLRILGLVVVVGAVLTASLLAAISSRHFGGITGDVMGATNEISRTISLLLIVVFLH
ncbi:MAG TPA: adenosylcobinamide-GDP ribazoletransferase [Candidatus Acidoferrales bacterium]|nr:adenosylcobinamide-GDP ribazoletransferase [Candidatus Acidoferrales bacterium]